MDFQRQLLIPGWDQQRLSAATAAVVGRGPLPTLVVWLLASLGVGRVLWAGAADTISTSSLDDWLSQGSPFDATQIDPYEFQPCRDAEFDWLFGGQPPSLVLSATDDDAIRLRWQAFCQAHSIPFAAGGTAGGGWFLTSGEPAASPALSPQPAACLAVAAILVDAARQFLFTSTPIGASQNGSLVMLAPDSGPPDAVVLVGAGGIGAWTAVGLAMQQRDIPAGAPRLRLLIVDHDLVEASNLPRTGTYSQADVGRPKSEALADFVTKMFPGTQVESHVKRFDRDFLPVLRKWQREESAANRPALVLVGAVDNAATRLALSEVAREAGAALLNAGTSLEAADVFVQDAATGPSLDEQMRGQLTAAAARERLPRNGARGNCLATPNYVVPGVLAAAMLTLRIRQFFARDPACRQAMHWRRGLLPLSRPGGKNA